MSKDDSIRLTIKALLEVVDSGAKNMEIAVILHNQPLYVSIYELHLIIISYI